MHCLRCARDRNVSSESLRLFITKKETILFLSYPFSLFYIHCFFSLCPCDVLELLIRVTHEQLSGIVPVMRVQELAGASDSISKGSGGSMLGTSAATQVFILIAFDSDSHYCTPHEHLCVTRASWTYYKLIDLIIFPLGWQRSAKCLAFCALQ